MSMGGGFHPALNRMERFFSILGEGGGKMSETQASSEESKVFKEKSGCCGPWEFSIKETADGLTINIKGDTERLRARREAIEAFKEFERKARKAGFVHPLVHFFAAKRDEK